MWKTLSLTGALVCALAVTADAQGGAGQSIGGQGDTIGGQGSTMEPAEKVAPEQGTVQSAEKGAAKKPGDAETLTGCLQKGDEPNTFTLANASKKSGSKLGSVQLVGAPAGLNLQEHLGHKVEVQARPIGAQAEEKMERGSEKSAGGTTMEHAKAEQHFQVKSVHHLASSCS
jgi:hypothetical protein